MDDLKILIVEDDLPIRNLIVTTLQTHDYGYYTAQNGQSAIRMASLNNPDIILLDLGLPDMDGVEIIKTVRSWSTVPIIVISARADDTDKIEALDAGADDYLTKPFSVAELLARIRATSRRLAYIKQDEPIFINGVLKIDYASRSVTIQDEPVHLTPIEYKLLSLLSQNIGKVLTHKYITKHVWGNEWESNLVSLRVFMTGLRKKINNNEYNIIMTHVGVGYSMVRL